MTAASTLCLPLGLVALSSPLLVAQQAAGLERLDHVVGTTVDADFGETFAQLDDMNADGVPEFAVASPSYLPFGAGGWGGGRVQVYSGADRQRLYSVDAVNGTDSLLGKTLTTIGDVDQDGARDLLVGSGGTIPAYVISARTGARLQELVTNSIGQVGMTAALIGDLDGDGMPEYALGLPGEVVQGLTSAGRLLLFDGASGLLRWELAGRAAFDNLGSLMLGPGDLDGDDIPDLLIAFPSSDQGGLTAVSGASGEVLYQVLRRELGMAPTEFAAVGDFNHDGHADYLATGYRNNLAGTWVQGVAKIISGLDGSVLHTIPGAQFEDFGRRAASVGDVDGDGHEDIGLIETPLTQLWQIRPTVVLISGATGDELTRLQGSSGGGFTLTLGALGDADGDGRDDFLLGIPDNWLAPGAWTGEFSVLSYRR